MTTLNAITAATTKLTVVKKPKTFCSRTNDECIMNSLAWEAVVYSNTGKTVKKTEVEGKVPQKPGGGIGLNTVRYAGRENLGKYM